MSAHIAKFKLPLILITMLLFSFLFGDTISPSVKSFFYATSLTLKALLFFVLPFIIFSFLFNSILALQNGVISFVILLVTMVYCSNFCAITTAEVVANVALKWLYIPADQTVLHDLEPMWLFTLPKFIPNEWALMLGLFSGVFFSLRPHIIATNIAHTLNHLAQLFLRRCFIPILPLFVFGFVLKIQHDGMLERVVMLYGSVLFVVVSIQSIYTLLLYWIAAHFSFRQMLEYMENVFPAAFTGFTTMSSAAAMPLSIAAAEQNLKDAEIARAIIPASVNIHTVGSAIGMTTLAMATLVTFGYPLPTALVALKFSLYYAIAKFAVAGVPGGAIFVAVPLLESQFHFSSEMTGVLTAVYMFFDPFGTATNVFGNGAFAILFHKIFRHKVVDEPSEESLLNERLI